MDGAHIGFFEIRVKSLAFICAGKIGFGKTKREKKIPRGKKENKKKTATVKIE